MRVDPYAKVRGVRRDTAASLEIDRITELPIVEHPTSEEIEAFCKEEVDARHYEDGFRLFATQVGAVLAWDLYEGLFAPIGVGWGKTLIALMIANRAFVNKTSKRSMLWVPPQVYLQLTRTDIPWARRRVSIKVPFILLGGRPKAERLAIARSGKAGCYITTYSQLSTQDAEEVLTKISPDLCILDEAHSVKNPTAARTKRLLRYLMQAQPRVVALSGTITSKSIKDYHHLISYALRENCPLPMDPALAVNWSYVLDAEADPSDAQVGPIRPIVAWARKHFPKQKLPGGVPGFRKAYKLRLNSAPGVVSTGDAQLGVSLVIENLPVPDHKNAEGFEKLSELIKQVEELWLTPSGDEIDYGFHKWRYLFELTAGFYYHQRWPTPAELIARAKLTVAEAEAYLDGAQDHHEALQEYHRALRKWLERRSRPRLDTPFLVGADMAAHGATNVGEDLFAIWRTAKDLEFDDMPKRLSEPVRICDYKIRHAIQWAQERKSGGIIWFHHDDLGRWMTAELIESGIDAIWCPSDSIRKGTNQIVGTAGEGGENSDKILVCSIGGHGQGKNLQAFQDQLFLQFPREALKMEQTIGRMHRNGQKADELIVHTMNTILFDSLNMAACLIDTLYMQQTTGARYKLLYASYNPLPKIYPDDFLRERGFVDVAMLDKEARQALEEKFGPLEQ
jgi:hypothetical protein